MSYCVNRAFAVAFRNLPDGGGPFDFCLENCLVQEYVYFLNNASRRELLELKGIGEKMAEYIIDLIAESPIKSLSDLEKIGLSSKQAYNLFTRAARTLFEDKAKDATVTC
ncbi:hypothetical protein K1719_012884 [Acacia pycnantha]|nr:hypothetical protein K1719_012884 [Acacia pycnantha]